jgi:hypothetical protein
VRIHELKIKQEYLNKLLDGSKPFEVRLDDRYYAVGDILNVKDRGGSYNFEVTYVLPLHEVPGLCEGFARLDKDFAADVSFILSDWVVLGLRRVK